MLGTLVNVGAILAGGLLGLLLKKGLNKRITDTVMVGLGLVVIYIGVSGALEGENTLIAVVAMAVGGIAGAALKLDERFDSLAHKLEKRIVKNEPEGSTFGEAFATSTLLFCVGAMAVVGSLNSGISGDHKVLFAKSILDGVAAMMFASALGPGVLLSAAAVLVYQGGITLLAQLVAPLLNTAAVNEMTCTGSLLIVAIGLNLTGATKIKVMNYILAIFLPILLCRFM